MLADGNYLSVCAYDCPDSCGMVATCSEGRLVELEGRKDNPYTRGFICHKERRWVRDLRGQDRLTSPLARRNGKFVLIGWDEALDMTCLLYTSDAADDLLCVDLGGRRLWQK